MIWVHMFADACEKMMKCTFPVICSRHFINGNVESGVGAFVVINPEGWALTAAHVVIPVVKHRECIRKIQDVKEWNATHPDEPKALEGEWSDHHSFWFGIPGTELENAYINMELDLAVIKLKNFRKEYVKEYPTFKDPNKIRTGTSLCRLGFPFTNAATSFDSNKNVFVINEGVLPIPFFPNDGIYTRTVSSGKTKDEDAFDKLWIETSTPGLRGQSGGPIFDREGRIVGIQSRTAHMKLGFKSTFQSGDPMPEQVMNLGLGVHIKTILDVLNRKGVKYKSEADDDGYRIIG